MNITMSCLICMSCGEEKQDNKREQCNECYSKCIKIRQYHPLSGNKITPYNYSGKLYHSYIPESNKNNYISHITWIQNEVHNYIVQRLTMILNKKIILDLIPIILDYVDLTGTAYVYNKISSSEYYLYVAKTKENKSLQAIKIPIIGKYFNVPKLIKNIFGCTHIVLENNILYVSSNVELHNLANGKFKLKNVFMSRGFRERMSGSSYEGLLII